MKNAAFVFVLATVVVAQQASPSLTKTESLQMENLQLKSQLIGEETARIEREKEEVSAGYKALQDEVKANHPGYELQGEKIVKTPEPQGIK